MEKIKAEELKAAVGGNNSIDICYALCSSKAQQEFLNGTDPQTVQDNLVSCKASCDSK